MDWDTYYANMIEVVDDRSKDKHTKVGAIIVYPDHGICSTGYNSFPRGIDDNIPARYERPTKYYFMAHAEVNAIWNAAKRGHILNGCHIYVDWHPCTKCAIGIIQTGMVEVILRHATIPNSDWNQEVKYAAEMFVEAGVKVRSLDGDLLELYKTVGLSECHMDLYQSVNNLI